MGREGKKKGLSKDQAARSDRRTFISNSLMGAGLVASHLTAGGLALRYLYPVKENQKQLIFAGLTADFPPGSATPFKTPKGQTINIIRTTHGYLALSDVCPHLGCRVYWDAQRSEFICPCHDGHFNSTGKPLSGPPKDMKVSLSQYKVVENNDMVFIEVDMKG